MTKGTGASLLLMTLLSAVTLGGCAYRYYDRDGYYDRGYYDRGYYDRGDYDRDHRDGDYGRRWHTVCDSDGDRCYRTTSSYWTYRGYEDNDDR